MSDRVVIALDAMGGDRAPKVVVDGAALALERTPNIHFLMFGNKAALAPLLKKVPALQDATTIRHTTEQIRGEDKPSAAIKSSRVPMVS